MKPSGKFGKLLIYGFCLLVAVFMTVQVAHVHTDSTLDSAHCQICSSAHIATGANPAWLTPFILELIGIVSVGDPSPGSRPVLVTSFIRPPPASF